MSAALPERKSGRASRFGGLILLGGAVALLLVGVFGFDRARSALPRAEHELASAEAHLNEARTRERLAQQNRVLLGVANTLQERAQNQGVLPQIWGERQINLRQQHLMREQVNQLLRTTARSKGQLLQPEEFELSVTNADEGLFEAPGVSAQPVMLSLRGTVRFRLSERSL